MVTSMKSTHRSVPLKHSAYKQKRPRRTEWWEVGTWTDVPNTRAISVLKATKQLLISLRGH